MKKERIFFLDLTRVVAMFIIFSYHFSVHFSQSNCFFTNFFLRSGTGTVGSTLFFMLSGASLFYQYEEKIDLKQYYKKRFLGTFPLFWLVYSLSFFANFILCKGFFTDLPLYKLGLTFIGMDGYLSDYTRTWYLLGEWFLGAIILLYLLFPLIRILVQKYPKIFLPIIGILYFAILLKYPFQIAPTKNFMVCLFSFSCGVYFMKYRPTISWWQAAICFILVLILENITLTQISHITLVYSIIAYLLFILLAFLGKKVEIGIFKQIILFFSRYSYVIFLIHHRILLRMGEYFSDVILDKYGILCAYLVGWILVFIIANIVHNFYQKLILNHRSLLPTNTKI